MAISKLVVVLLQQEVGSMQLTLCIIIRDQRNVHPLKLLTFKNWSVFFHAKSLSCLNF